MYLRSQSVLSHQALSVLGQALPNIKQNGASFIFPRNFTHFILSSFRCCLHTDALPLQHALRLYAKYTKKLR